MVDDTYVCSVCHVKVKTKLKRAHESGAKHRDSVRKLTSLKRPATTVREAANEESIESHSVAARIPAEKNEEEEFKSVLPDNFFDNKVKEKAAAANAEIEKEFSKFMNEVERLEQKEEEVEDKDEAIRNDLQMIDEQIEMWKNLNELEKQKEQLIESVHARVMTNKAEQVVMDNDEMDDSDEDFDAFGLDWRSRKI